MDKTNTEISIANQELIIRKLDSIMDTMDRRFEEWSEDRKTLTDVVTEVKILSAKIDGARDDIEAQTKKLLGKIEERLQPLPDVVSDSVSEAVKKKKGLFK